jgi:transposase
MRYELTDYEWTTIKPMLLNKPRGVRRVNDRRVLNGIFWVLRSGAPWRDLPRSFGPYTTCYNRVVRWRRAGVCVWAKIMNALAGAHDAAVQMIDTSIVRVHQHDGHGNGRAQTETQFKTFHATVHVTRVEEWFVEAESAEEARALLTAGEGHRSHVGECLNVDIERVEGS